jgi:hypothetical protein
MNKVKSFLKRMFSSRPIPTPEPETETRQAEGCLTVIRGSYEFHAGAVVLMRVETSEMTEETVYYPEDAQVFFIDLTSSLSKGRDIILQVNKHPQTLGLRKNDQGQVSICQVELLGRD